jgi:photosystem II stability/assembly factor-like uncharacterized protein
MIGKDPIESRLQRYFEDADRQRSDTGFENRIIRVVRDDHGHARSWSPTRQLAGALAIGLLGMGVAASVVYLRAHQVSTESGPGPSRSTGLSIGTQGGGDWIVVRGIDYGAPGRTPSPATNALYHTSNGGQSWQEHLHFEGIYDGMSWTPDGQTGVVWAFVMTTPCGSNATTCTIPPSEIYTFYATSDGGQQWSQHSQVFGDFGDNVYFNGMNGWMLSRQDYAQGQTPTVPQLLRTTDGGATWTKVADLAELNSGQLGGGIWGYTAGVGQTNLVFANTLHGWLATGMDGASGHGGLLETTDGGKTWHDVILTIPTAMSGEQAVFGYPVLLANGQALLPVFFGQRTDVNNFSIDHRYLYSSSDSGKSWSHAQPLRANGLEPTGNEWQQFYLDGNHWWFTAINQRTAGEPVAQAGPGIGRTADGGKTWQVFRDKNAPTILQMTFTDANQGWAFAVTGPDNTNTLLRTTDGGAHWNKVPIP